MTMSLSVARPIVCAPLGFCMAPDRDGSSAWNILVARLETSGGLASTGAIWVFGAACVVPTAGLGGGGKFGGALGGYAGVRPVPLSLVGYIGCPGGRGG